jgi:Spy/CpxP family protein refolding chaperone
MKDKICFIVLAAVLLGTMPAVAQVSDTDYLQQLRTDIQSDRQALVAASLGLTDEEGEAFWPVYRDYRSDMAKVGDRMQTLIQDYAEIWDTATEEQAKTMVNQMLAIQRDELKVRKSHLSKFRKVLPEVKVARFLQIENKIDVIVKLGLADVIPLIEAAE